MNWPEAACLIAFLLLCGLVVIGAIKVALANAAVQLEKIRPRRTIFGEMESRQEEEQS